MTAEDAAEARTLLSAAERNTRMARAALRPGIVDLLLLDFVWFLVFALTPNGHRYSIAQAIFGLLLVATTVLIAGGLFRRRAQLGGKTRVHGGLGVGATL